MSFETLQRLRISNAMTLRRFQTKEHQHQENVLFRPSFQPIIWKAGPKHTKMPARSPSLKSNRTVLLLVWLPHAFPCGNPQAFTVRTLVRSMASKFHNTNGASNKMDLLRETKLARTNLNLVVPGACTTCALSCLLLWPFLKPMDNPFANLIAHFLQSMHSPEIDDRDAICLWQCVSIDAFANACGHTLRSISRHCSSGLSALFFCKGGAGPCIDAMDKNVRYSVEATTRKMVLRRRCCSHIVQIPPCFNGSN